MSPKRPAHCLWAVLIARIYEVFPLRRPLCGEQMRIIAFITYSADIGQILEHVGAETEPPRITPARGPSLWDVLMRMDFQSAFSMRSVTSCTAAVRPIASAWGQSNCSRCTAPPAVHAICPGEQ
jgi:hypothetical protein